LHSNDKNDYTKIVYVHYADDPEECDSHKVSFHVRFTDDDNIAEVYALEMEHGQKIGHSCPL
jgi:hypothetical protein